MSSSENMGTFIMSCGKGRDRHPGLDPGSRYWFQCIANQVRNHAGLSTRNDDSGLSCRTRSGIHLGAKWVADQVRNDSFFSSIEKWMEVAVLGVVNLPRTFVDLQGYAHVLVRE